MSSTDTSLQTRDGHRLAIPAGLSHLEIGEELIASSNNAGAWLFSAKDLRLQRDVLLKIIALDLEDREELVTDARLVGNLKHHAYAQIYSLDVFDEKLYIAFEAIQGQTVADWVTQQVGQEKLVLLQLLDLARALAEAHQAHLITGELRIADLCIDQNGRLRIQHFGFAHRLAERSKQESEPSSLSSLVLDDLIHYLAPERFSQKHASAESEVFALGVIAYYLCTGHYPHASMSGLSLIAAQVQVNSTQWNWPTTLSASLVSLIQNMTAQECSKRYTMSQVVAACEAMRENEVSTSPSAHILELQSKLDQFTENQRRKKYLAIGLLTVALAIGAWQYQDYWLNYIQALRPYSEALALNQGASLLEEHAQVPRQELLDQADKHFSEVLTRTPQHPQAVAGMAYVYLQRYQSNQRDEVWLQKAIASTQQALNLDPKIALSQIAHARVLQWHHKLDDALVAAEKGISLAPQNALAWHAKMSILLEMGRQEAAISFAENGAKVFPKDRYMLDLLGGIYLARGQFQAAEQVLKRSIERRRDGRLAYALLGVVLTEQKKDSEALQYVQRGLEVNPSPNLYGALGDILLNQKKFDEAANAYEKAVSMQQGVAGSYVRWLSFAESLMWTKHRVSEAPAAFERARSLLETRLQRAPDDASLKVNLAHILARLKNRSAAKALIESVQISDLRRDSGIVRMAFVYELLGMRDKALQVITSMKDMGIPVDLRHPVFEELQKDPQYIKISPSN